MALEGEEKSEAMKEIEKRVQEEIDGRAEAESVKVKTLADIVAERKIKRLFVPSLNCDIFYEDLTIGDYFEFTKPRDDKMELAVEVLLRTWGRADATVTKETLMQLGLPICAEIIDLLGWGIKRIPLGTSKQSNSPQNPTQAKSS